MIKAEPPAVLSDGTLIVPFVQFADFGLGLPRRRAWVSRSSNGVDFSRPIFIGDACGPPPDFLLSSFAADPSAGPFRDRMYLRVHVGGLRRSRRDAFGQRWRHMVGADQRQRSDGRRRQPSSDGDGGQRERRPRSDVAGNDAAFQVGLPRSLHQRIVRRWRIIHSAHARFASVVLSQSEAEREKRARRLFRARPRFTRPVSRRVGWDSRDGVFRLRTALVDASPVIQARARRSSRNIMSR